MKKVEEMQKSVFQGILDRFHQRVLEGKAQLPATKEAKEAYMEFKRLVKGK